MAAARLRLCLDEAGGGPAADTAISRATLERVDRGELPATLRLSQPPRVVAFSARDARSPGFPAAVAAARAHGFEAVVRLAGGRAAVFTPRTIAFALAEPTPDPSRDIEARFATMASNLRDAFAELGVDARIGEVPGEYCPGAWSVNARGAAKLAGIGQRLLRRSAHTGGVVVVGDATAITDVLRDVYAAMEVAWDPAATGQLVDEATVGWAQVRDAIVDAFARTHELEPWQLDAATLALARDREPEHLVGEAARAREARG